VLGIEDELAAPLLIVPVLLQEVEQAAPGDAEGAHSAGEVERLRRPGG
jgi:hypothetical protein